MRVFPVLPSKVANRKGIPIRRGVKQGCPLSPLLFAICYDVLLDALEEDVQASLYAFADDLAVSAEDTMEIIFAINIIDRFSFFSGLGINKAKSAILFAHKATPRDSKLLADSIWDLQVVNRHVYLGVLLGKDINEEDIYQKAFTKYIDRYELYSDFISSSTLHFKIVVFNVFLLSIFSYLFPFYILPAPMRTRVKEDARKACIPFNGGGFGYSFLVSPCNRFGLKLPLRDAWAANMTALITNFDFSEYHKVPFSNLSIIGKPYLDNINWSSLLIEDQIAAAAYDFMWHYCVAEEKVIIPDFLLGKKKKEN